MQSKAMKPLLVQLLEGLLTGSRKEFFKCFAWVDSGFMNFNRISASRDYKNRGEAIIYLLRPFYFAVV